MGSTRRPGWARPPRTTVSPAPDRGDLVVTLSRAAFCPNPSDAAPARDQRDGRLVGDRQARRDPQPVLDRRGLRVHTSSRTASRRELRLPVGPAPWRAEVSPTHLQARGLRLTGHADPQRDGRLLLRAGPAQRRGGRVNEATAADYRPSGSRTSTRRSSSRSRPSSVGATAVASRAPRRLSLGVRTLRVPGDRIAPRRLAAGIHARSGVPRDHVHRLGRRPSPTSAASATAIRTTAPSGCSVSSLPSSGADLDKLKLIERDTDEIDIDDVTVVPQLAFVDAEHTDQAVRRDAGFCDAVMRGEGCIVFHDAAVVLAPVSALTSTSSPTRAARSTHTSSRLPARHRARRPSPCSDPSPSRRSRARATRPTSARSRTPSRTARSTGGRHIGL